MEKYKTILVFTVCTLTAMVVIGCTSGGGIPKAEYSKLATPQETFEFAQKSVGADDPEAFYHCLANYIKEQFDLQTLKLGWALAGKYFFIFLEAEVTNVETPAPDLAGELGYPPTAKVTIKYEDLVASFLLIQEDDQWKIANPQHYDLPDLKQLKKQGRTPWHSEIAYYRSTPEHWRKPKKIKRAKGKRYPDNRPKERTDYFYSSKSNYRVKKKRK